jgi:hypothetical protein
METRLRLLIVLAGLPEPATNLDVYDGHGEWLGRADLIYSVYKIIIEYDGERHWTEPRKVRMDILRREELRSVGYEVIVLFARDIYLQPRYTLDRIRSALVRRGHPDAPRTLSAEWELHLPARGPGDAWV